MKGNIGVFFLVGGEAEVEVFFVFGEKPVNGRGTLFYGFFPEFWVSLDELVGVFGTVVIGNNGEF